MSNYPLFIAVSIVFFVQLIYIESMSNAAENLETIANNDNDINDIKIINQINNNSEIVTNETCDNDESLCVLGIPDSDLVEDN